MHPVLTEEVYEEQEPVCPVSGTAAKSQPEPKKITKVTLTIIGLWVTVSGRPLVIRTSVDTVNLTERNRMRKGHLRIEAIGG
jgi:hypothetical protein